MGKVHGITKGIKSEQLIQKNKATFFDKATLILHFFKVHFLIGQLLTFFCQFLYFNKNLNYSTKNDGR